MVDTDDVRHDIGELYDSINDADNAVMSLITRAENFVKLQLSSDYEEIVRPLAAAMAVNQVWGSIDPVNKTIGSLTVGNKDLRGMYNNFMSEARRAANIKGISLDGFRILMRDTHR